MAYVIDSKQFNTSVSDTDFSIETPVHATDDWIYVSAAFGNFTVTTAPTGYTQIFNQLIGTAGRMVIWRKKATSSAEPDPTLTISGASTIAMTAITVRDADPTTPDDDLQFTVEGASSTTHTFPAATASVAGPLILDYLMSSSTAAVSVPSTPVKQPMATVTTDRESVLFAWGKTASGAVATDTVTTASIRCAVVRIVVKNKSGGKVAPVATGGMNWIVRGGAYDNLPTLNQITVKRATLQGVATEALTTLTASNAVSGGPLESWAVGSQVTVAPPNTGTKWYGFYITFTSTADFSKWVSVGLQDNFASSQQVLSTVSLYVEDNSGNWAIYYVGSKGSSERQTFRLSALDVLDSGGVINLADVKHFGHCWKRTGTSTASKTVNFGLIGVNAPMVFTGYVTPRTISRYLKHFGARRSSSSQGELQEVLFSSVQIGDGTNPTEYVAAAASTEYPFGVNVYKGDDYQQTITIKASASDIIDLRQSVTSSAKIIDYTLDSASSTSATYYEDGAILRGARPTWKTGVSCAGMTVVGCDTFDAKGAAVNTCSISKTRATSTQAAIKFDANSSMDGTTIDVTGTSAGYHLELGTAVTAFTLTDVVFTGTPGTDKIHVLRTTGTVTITKTASVSLSASDVTSDGASVSIVSPTLDITLTGLVAGSQVVIFNTGTTTEVFRDNNSSTSETASSLPAATYDYTVMKAGYFPLRSVGVVLGSASISIPIQQQVDRAYVASSGLTYGTTATLSGTVFAVTVATTVQNWYSFWIEAWIAQSALTNKAFPLEPFGPNSFSLNQNYEFSGGSIQYLSRDGFRYITSGGGMAAVFCAILSQGVTAGLQAEYEQVDGGAVVNAINTGNVDQVIQVYGDVTHGNFDYRGSLDFKVQANGYRQAETDVVATYGNLEEQLYVISLPTVPITGLTLGNPSPTGLSITDNSASPVSWDAGDGAKNYSLTITDTGGNTGDTILRWLNYNLSLDATFQGRDPFEWPEMVLFTGSSYETLRGTLHKTGGDVTVGVRVVTGAGAAHPAFTRFQSDDGTYGTPPVTSSISVTNMPTAGAHIRLQIENTTALSAPAWASSTAYTAGQKVKRSTGIGTEQTAGLYFVATTAGTSGGTEPTWNTTVGNTTTDGTVTWTCYAILFYDANPGAATYSTTYLNARQFIAGDNVTVRFAALDTGTTFKTYENLTVAAASGFSFNVMAESDAVYAANGIDGRATAVTDIYTADYADDEIVLDANLNFTNPKGYAFYCGELTTSNGMWNFWGGITALDVGNYRVNVDIVNIMLDESGGFVRQEDTDTSRWYRSDGSRPYKDPTTGGAGLFVNWMNPVFVQAVGSAVLPADIVAIADEVRTELTTELGEIGDIKTKTDQLTFNSGNVAANIKAVNSLTVDGAGTEGDPWGPA